MAQKLFKILDRDGNEMPGHYSGRQRTYDEAKTMVDRLNINGEYKPYVIIPAEPIGGDDRVVAMAYSVLASVKEKYPKVDGCKVLNPIDMDLLQELLDYNPEPRATDWNEMLEKARIELHTLIDLKWQIERNWSEIKEHMHIFKATGNLIYRADEPKYIIGIDPYDL